MATVIQAQDKAGHYMKYDTKSKMRFILNYVHDPEKTNLSLQGGTYLMNPEDAYEEFMLTKQLWGKDQEGKRMCMHYIQSFKPGEVTPELAKELADEFVKQKIFKGFQISYAVHTDKDHIHTHFILNTVNIEDGHKWQLADLKILRRESDRLCKKHGLSVVPEREVKKSKSSAQKDAEKKGTSWKKETQMAVDKALEIAENPTEFFSIMKKQGYQVRWKNEYKYVLFINSDGKKMRNKIFEHPENYTKEEMLKRFRENYKEHWKKDPEKERQTTSFRTETFFVVRDAARVAISKEDFIELMEDNGYHVQWDDEHKYITFWKDGYQPVRNRSFYPNEEYTKEGLEEKFKRNEEKLNRIRSGKYDAKNVVELQKLDKLFLLFSIIEGADDNAYPHQTNLHEHSVRSIDEWKREQAKGHGMDWER
ncbi:relaxase/mobilization nuclease domain-containing protein [Anaerostipes hadrus]|uniref:relaxase/mobilization nuclease domain-containing protein n=1 Tax=Anaerostipes hadrus TaxID=649756 RepID=UPI00156D41F2|nr:relaxase/mobilization nuclease domain-containing protein [Anaerostipes hadrus]NSG79215.1 relaxase/mobilization nuclease domain-containing protein [Anaerostipes hadrus]NSG98626.1 relaxase/mobilization nuclease domain-containing protein [Anaerostipes hadrus]NSH46297.1 relaxase/mobilization nuclease domain-containing protein [Anaerostipes hadrus]